MKYLALLLLLLPMDAFAQENRCLRVTYAIPLKDGTQGEAKLFLYRGAAFFQPAPSGVLPDGPDLAMQPPHPDAYEAVAQGRIAVEGGADDSSSRATMAWQLTTETRIIGVFSCRMAYLTRGGERYTAWYAPEIPLPHGPDDWGGLPGLILEVERSDGLAEYRFQSYEAFPPAYLSRPGAVPLPEGLRRLLGE